MSEKIVVLGGGYAGTRAVLELEKETGINLTWISDRDYHLVLHESHRIIRDPGVKEKITIPVNDIKKQDTEFIQGAVTGVDTDSRTVLLEEGSVDYDYLLVALGSDTAFYGIPGLRENAHTLKSLDDALGIHSDIKSVVAEASGDDSAQVVVGGAGLSGIQCAGEVAEYRDHHGVEIDIYLVEALEEILPGHNSELQSRLRRMLESRGVEIRTDDPITEADDSNIYFEENGALEYDVFIWTGGITGRDSLEDAGVDKEHNRLNVSSKFRTSDERVFAVGDSAVVDQGDGPAPATAQAAWQAAEVAAGNVVRAARGEELEEWVYRDKGTLVSVGEQAVAHDVMGIPVKTFDSYPAVFLKKFVGARWIASVVGWGRALRAWSVL